MQFGEPFLSGAITSAACLLLLNLFAIESREGRYRILPPYLAGTASDRLGVELPMCLVVSTSGDVPDLPRHAPTIWEPDCRNILLNGLSERTTSWRSGLDSSRKRTRRDLNRISVRALCALVLRLRVSVHWNWPRHPGLSKKSHGCPIGGALVFFYAEGQASSGGVRTAPHD